MNPTVHELAMLARQVYEPDGGTPPPGWEVLANSRRYFLGGGDARGYFGAVYLSPTRQRVFAHRGTSFAEFADVSSLLAIALGKRAPQFEIAREFYSAVGAEFGQSSAPVVHVGHSQGGAIASLLGVVNSESAVTFNTVGVRDLLPTYGFSETGSYPQVTNIRAKWDPAQNVGTAIGNTVTVSVSSFAFVPDDIEPAVPLMGSVAFPAIGIPVSAYFANHQHSIDALVEVLAKVPNLRLGSADITDPSTVAAAFSAALQEYEGGAQAVSEIGLDAGRALTQAETIFEQDATAATPRRYRGEGLSDLVMGGDGADSLAGGEARDVLFGGEGSDIVFAGGDADVVLGGGGDDRLFGEAGADVVVGNAGSDRLIGGIGDDVLVGGVGTDTYVFAAGDGQDRIVDAGQNYLVKDGRLIAGLFVRDPQSGAYGLVNDQSVTLTFASPATISFGGGDSVTLLNQTEAASFAQGAFGIRLIDAPSAPTGEVRTFFGDKADYDSDPAEPGVQTQTDAFGNTVRADGQDGRPDAVQDDRADTFYGSGADEVERFATAGGDDLVYADGPSSAASTAGGRDLIEAGAGRDVVHAGGAEDWVEGGSEGDILAGNAGNDALFAETSNGQRLTIEGAIAAGESGVQAPGPGDILSGDAGDDVLLSGAGADLLLGGEGAELIVVGAGDDNIYGDASVNGAVLDWTATRTVTTSGGTVTYLLETAGVALAGTGATAAGGGDAIYGGAGADWVFAGAGDDYVEGGNTPDDANVEDDVLFGEAGSDILVGGSGKDALHGDSASVDAAGLSGDDYLDGGLGDDTLRGGGGADVLVGGEGNDTLIGNDGDDILIANRGEDVLLGGPGRDTYVIHRGDGLKVIQDAPDDALGKNASVIVFGDGITRSQVTFTVGSLVIDAGEGDQVRIDGFDPNNALATPVLERIEFADGTMMTYQDILDQGFELDGTDEDDDIAGTNLNENIDARGGEDIVRSLGGRDRVLGGAGADQLHGGEGDDTLDGGTGADALYGDEGRDSLIGGDGDDLLDGGAGDDALAGGDGVDSYRVYGGMGADRVTDGEGGETNVLTLAPGMSAAGLRFTQSGDDLEVGLKGTTDTLTLEDYYARGQSWTIRDADGNETDLEEAIAAPDPNAGNFVAQLREEARQGQLARVGGAALLAGWKPLGGSLFEGDLDRAFLAHTDRTTTETFTSVSTGQVLASNTTREIEDTVLEFGTLGAPHLNWDQHRLETARIDSDDAIIVGPGNALPRIDTAGEAVVTLRKEQRRYNERNTFASTAGGVVSYDTGSAVVLANVFYDNELHAWNQFASVTKVDEPLAAIWAQPRNAIVGAQALVDMTRREHRYLNVAEIVGGASDNTITAFSGGAGIFSLLTLVDGGAGNDTIAGSGFLYGNAGDDSITAGESTIIGGDGNDTLTGTGATRFIFTAGEIGVDTVTENGSYSLPYLQWLYSIGDVGVLLERHEHGGMYRLDLEGRGNYYASFAEADAVRQSYGFGEIVFIEPLDGPAPVVRRDDTQALEQLIAAGVMPRDTVEFGPGLTLADLALDIRVDAAVALDHPGQPWFGGGVLSVRWNGGAAGFDVQVPDVNYGFAGANLLTDGDPADDPADGSWRGYRLGAGIEQFRFADGSTYFLEDVLARARVHFGDYAFAPLPGEQVIDRRHDAVVFAPEFSLFGLQVSRDGADLVFRLPFNDAQGRIAGWYSDPGNVPTMSLRFSDGTEVDAAMLTELGLEVHGTEGDDALAGLAGFDDVIFGAGGNDSIAGDSGADALFGDAGDDAIEGGEGADFLAGGEGADLLRGGAGDDEFEDSTGNLIEAGAGDDLIYHEGRNFIAAGPGADTIETFGPDAVIAFNAGDGTDTIYAADSFTLSLGGGVRAADLALSADGDDLVLSIGATDSVRLTRAFEPDPRAWPAITLQLFGSVHTFDFGAVIADFQAALAADPGLGSFPIGNSLEAHRTGLSETEALGGVLAHQYGTTASLGALSDSRIREVLADPAFGAAAQPIALETSNQAPVLANPIADQTVSEDAAFDFSVPAGTFADPDAGDALTFAAALADGSALPGWLAFDAASGSFSGTPAQADVGLLDIRVTATDLGGLSASDTFALSVANVNDAPVLANPIADQSATEDTPFSFAVPADTVADEDPGDPIAWFAARADGSALPAWLSFDAAARILSGTPGNDDVGAVDVTVTATDAAGFSVSDTFTVSVANVNDAPVVANAPGEVFVTAGSPFAFALAADTFADPDAGDALVYSAVSYGGGPLPAWLSFDPATLGFSGTASAADIGSWPIAVSALDTAGASVSAAFNLAVRSEESATVVGTSGDNVLYGNTGAEHLIGRGGNDGLFGFEGNDTLRGGGGNDVLQGGAGSDVLRAGGGRNLLDGGSGDDLIYGGRDAGLIIGGAGNDVIRTGRGTDVIVFNRGDGQDTVWSDREGNNTLSLGGGIRYEDLRFRKSGKDLVLELGGSDAITFKHWYAGQGRTSLLNIQIVTEAIAGFDDSAADPMQGARVNVFDARGLVEAFDRARAADPYLTSWDLSNALTQFHLWGADDAALGGDLAYQYGLRGSLAGIGLAAAQEAIGAPGFGSEAQSLRPFSGLSEGFVKLS